MRQIEPADGSMLRDRVYESILDLLSGKMWTGTENLSDAALAESLGVSRTPVRMALARLESEGLVSKAKGKGWRVTPLTREDIEEIFELKGTLEALASRRAAERITPERAAALRSALMGLKQAADGGDKLEWVEVDDQFHGQLFEMSGNARLWLFADQLNRQWYRYRMGYIAMEGQLAVLYRQHEAICVAIEDGDPDAAAQATLEHLEHVRAQLQNVVEYVLSPFLGSMEGLSLQ